MTEVISTPGWNQPPTTVDAWLEALRACASEVTATRESTAATWIEVGKPRLRGYALMQGLTVEAINFEVAPPDPTPGLDVIRQAAQRLGWELDEDVEPDDDDDD